MVLRVDKEKGYIDLSKRRVSAEDVQKCDDRFQRSKAVHSIVRHVAETQHVDIEELYSKTAWPLYEKFGHAYEAFCAAITDANSIFNEELSVLGGVHMLILCGCENLEDVSALGGVGRWAVVGHCSTPCSASETSSCRAG